MAELDRQQTIKVWFADKVLQGLSWQDYVKGLVTPFNTVAGAIVLVGLYFIVLRFTQGLGAVTSASDVQPWGLFLSWGLFAGVPLSAAGYVLGSAVYIFGIKEYHPLVKNAILIGFLGYFFAVVFLMIDLGRPWRIYYPMFLSFGPASVMFLVAWHVALYLSVQFLEFSPSIFDWAGFKVLRQWASKAAIGLTIAGVMLSTLHQSALGAMFLLAPGKLHPLWYSPYIPVLFFISSIAAGLSMVIVVGIIAGRLFRNRADSDYLKSTNGLTLGLGKAAAFVLFTYLGVKLITLAHGHNWALLNTSWGYWFLLEVIGFVVVPCILFFAGARNKNVGVVWFAALLTITGTILNRLNISLFAFNWNIPGRELFSWNEFIIILAVVTVEVLVYRWIVNRMPVLREHSEHEE